MEGSKKLIHMECGVEWSGVGWSGVEFEKQKMMNEEFI